MDTAISSDSTKDTSTQQISHEVQELTRALLGAGVKRNRDNVEPVLIKKRKFNLFGMIKYEAEDVMVQPCRNCGTTLYQPTNHGLCLTCFVDSNR